MDITLPFFRASYRQELGQVCKRVNNTINRKEKWKIKFGYKK